MEQITSVQNIKIKNYNKLKKKKERDKQQRAIIEGFHLIEEAFNSDVLIEQLFMIEPSRIPEEIQQAAKECFIINQKVAEALSGTVTPQGIFAVIQKSSVNIDHATQVLVLDRIQDPGNLGTLIRTADAAGLDLVVVAKGTADVYQEKVLRASQGSVFHIPTVEVPDVVKYVQNFSGPVYGTALHNAISYRDVQSQQDTFALVLGNEGQGMSEELLQITTQNMMIPLHGRAESLNVAIAAGILMFHLKG
ncbi:RNA methyltransferase [Staphylococcus sp. 17KM0847]|uniref:TrmH family RNA methyltransferase n=1 Tax=Staphylococcus sp. 17KM0847 TaxID=2583989 RepID=UPI0015DD0B27|nr:RNA methyltransferase [Staphylococcus sp. 17KM0847]QLK85769.1 RNA methyltransferase [Staphylococcus sp. 17KM0847]